MVPSLRLRLVHTAVSNDCVCSSLQVTQIFDADLAKEIKAKRAVSIWDTSRERQSADVSLPVVLHGGLMDM